MRNRTWGELNPVTRSVPSGKRDNRNEDKQERKRIGREFSDGFDAGFLFRRATGQVAMLAWIFDLKKCEKERCGEESLFYDLYLN